jgi:hypothetical protein
MDSMESEVATFWVWCTPRQLKDSTVTLSSSHTLGFGGNNLSNYVKPT